MAAMTRLNLGSSSGEDDLSLDLCLDILVLPSFLVDSFDVKVKGTEEKIDTALYVYLKDYQRAPWWNAVSLQSLGMDNVHFEKN